MNALGEAYDASVPGCSGPISGGARTGVRDCMLTLSTGSANPAQDIGKIFIKCFVAFDLSGGGAEWTKGQAKTCRSLPHCIKIQIDGRPPIFVAPTPGFDDLGQRVPPYSRDGMGRYVLDRTDVPHTRLLILPSYSTPMQCLQRSLMKAGVKLEQSCQLDTP